MQAYEAISGIVGAAIDEDNLKSLYLSLQDQSCEADSPAFALRFVGDVKEAWKLHGDVNYERYGFRDRVAQLKIALYGLDRKKYGSLMPLHMKSKIDDMLQVGIRD